MLTQQLVSVNYTNIGTDEPKITEGQLINYVAKNREYLLAGIAKHDFIYDSEEALSGAVDYILEHTSLLNIDISDVTDLIIKTASKISRRDYHLSKYAEEFENLNSSVEDLYEMDSDYIEYLQSHRYSFGFDIIETIYINLKLTSIGKTYMFNSVRNIMLGNNEHKKIIVEDRLELKYYLAQLLKQSNSIDIIGKLTYNRNNIDNCIELITQE